jgi:hypothetical protein
MIKRINPALKQVGTPSLAASRGWTLHEPAASGIPGISLRRSVPMILNQQPIHADTTRLVFSFSSPLTCFSGDLTTCIRLMEQGAVIDAKDDNGWTPLRFAVQVSSSPSASAFAGVSTSRLLDACCEKMISCNQSHTLQCQCTCNTQL